MKSLTVLLLIALTAALGQQATTSGNPSLLDPNLPSVYIRFDHVGKRVPVHSDESGEGVWLRLHNNTKAAISLRTESLYVGSGVRPLKLWNGENVLGLRDGVEASPCYRVEERRPSSSASKNKSAVAVDQITEYQMLSLGTCGDVGSTSWVPSASSILISLPKEQLATGHRISIPFRYEWEPASPDVEHRVFFYAGVLSKADTVDPATGNLRVTVPLVATTKPSH
jgi:hypothetical protein